MIRVIEENDVYHLINQSVTRCDHCGKMLLFEQSDVKGDYEATPFGTNHWTYITCPNCKHEIHF